MKLHECRRPDALNVYIRAQHEFACLTIIRPKRSKVPLSLEFNEDIGQIIDLIQPQISNDIETSEPLGLNC
ncbi:hypothetical protein D3C76_1437210 [compost metagenome]